MVQFALGFDGKLAGSAPQSLSCLPFCRFLFARKKKEDEAKEPQKVPAAEERMVREVLSAWKREKSREAHERARAMRRISRISWVKVTEIPAGQTKLGARTGPLRKLNSRVEGEKAETSLVRIR